MVNTTRKPSILPRKAPVQVRSTATRDAILQAATHILTVAGLSGFNTNRVAEVAGVSIGSLYQYYPNKGALLTALIVAEHDAFLLEFDALMRSLGAANLAETTAQLIDLGLKHQFERAPLAAALDFAERELGADALLRPQQQMLVAALISALAPHASLLSTDIKTAAIDCLCIVKSMIDGAAMRGEPNSAALRERVERATLGYLLGPKLTGSP
jgi:AcrR family transcriptional regulator